MKLKMLYISLYDIYEILKWYKSSIISNFCYALSKDIKIKIF